jgi:glycerophosphoryl diester phosphodiesterase
VDPFGRRRPVIVGHRGAPLAAPENTPASFSAALAAGADWVECDVRCSRDGVAVVVHHPTTRDGVRVAAQSAPALAAKGVWAFDEVLTLLPAGAGVDVEIKHHQRDGGWLYRPRPRSRQGRRATAAVHIGARALPLVLASLRDQVGRRPLLLSSFDPGTLAAAAAALPDVPTGLLHPRTVGLRAALTRAGELGAAVLCTPLGTRGLDAAGIRAVHAAGRSVLVWTVDDPARAVALAAAGADAICTNDPAALVSRLRAGRTP